MTLVVKGITELEIARKKEGLTATDLARQIGMSPSAVHNFERGHARASMSFKTKVSEVIGRPVEELFPESQSNE